MLSIVAAALLSSPLVVSDSNELVVHEWGTLTTIQGSDGVTLEGLHHEEEPLPDFVHAIRGFDAIDVTLEMTKGIGRPIRGCTVKMETPVTYFYSPRSMVVRAHVGFEHGMLTQWYPDVADAGVRGAEKEGTIDFAKVERSWLEWQIELLAPKFGLDSTPTVEPGKPWLAARIPQSNCVRAHIAAHDDQPARDETEEFLFYRGLARFDLPIRARTGEGSVVEIANTSRVPSDVLTHLFVLNVRDGHGEFSYAPRVEPGKTIRVARPLSADSPSVDAMVQKLSPQMVAALVESGLFEPEARAMVETWSRSYFHTPGLRVLYVIPQRITDALLPLDISPAPAAMVRVMVGRLECIAPEREVELQRDLLLFEEGGDDQKQVAWGRISKLDRFLEPHLRRAIAIATNPRVADRASRWLNDE